MREINLDVNESPRRTFLCYGHTGSGKTHFAASAPRPLFFSDATESGWTTIQSMDPSTFYEPAHRPKVFAIEKMSDMHEAIAKAAPLVASGAVQTIVVDSLTFYADMYLAGLFRAGGGSANNLRAYGDLGSHLRDLRVSIHQSFPRAHIIWLCLAADPSEENPVGGPLIPGKQASKFPAGCDYVFFHRKTAAKEGEKFHLHTRQFGNYFARPRNGLNLPAEIVNTDFRSVLEMINSQPGGDVEDGPLVAGRPVAPAAQAASPAAPASAPAANGVRPVVARPRPVVARRP